ncbi:MAG: monoterpene epsilon-lactone hydrolase [Paracoccaceae bacterium]|jgi:monoterpene epsilon-lactone hydrolase
MAVSRAQRLSSFFARFGQKPALSLPLPQKMARMLFDLNARIIYKTPHDLTVEHADLGGVPGAWVGRQGQAKDGVILYLHGGAFVLGSHRSYRHLVAIIAAEAGMAGYLPEYRLAPEHRYPAALEDAMSVYGGLLEDGFEPDEIVFVGDSAGGGLILSLLHLLGVEEMPMPRAVALMSPVADLTLSSPSIQENKRADPLIAHAWAARGIRDYLGGHDATDPQVSGIFGQFNGVPPVLFQVGETEILRDDTLRMAEVLRSQGVDVTVKVWKDVPHVWHLMAGRVPEADQGIAELAAFLRAQAPERSELR